MTTSTSIFPPVVFSTANISQQKKRQFEESEALLPVTKSALKIIPKSQGRVKPLSHKHKLDTKLVPERKRTKPDVVQIPRSILNNETKQRRLYMQQLYFRIKVAVMRAKISAEKPTEGVEFESKNRTLAQENSVEGLMRILQDMALDVQRA